MPHNKAADADALTDHLLTENFSLPEVEAAGAPVADWMLPHVKEYLQGPQLVRTFLGRPMKVLSAYRPPAYNTHIKGAKRSYHQWFHVDENGIHPEPEEGRRDNAIAMDFVVPGVAPEYVAEVFEGLMRLNLVAPGGLGVYKWGVHYDNRGKFVKWRG